MNQDNTVNVDVKLGVNKFNVDEGHPHIIPAEHPDLNEFRKLLKARPAGLYKQDESGNIHFDSAGCTGAERVEYCAATQSSTNGNIRSEHLALIFATANGFCL